jgi:hypothetical protein
MWLPGFSEGRGRHRPPTIIQASSWSNQSYIYIYIYTTTLPAPTKIDLDPNYGNLVAFFAPPMRNLSLDWSIAILGRDFLLYITAIPHRVSTAITQTNGEAHVAVGSKSSPFFLSWPTPRRSSRRIGPSFEFLELYMSTVYTCRQLQSGRHYIYYYLSSKHQMMRRQSGPPSIGRVLFSPYP